MPALLSDVSDAVHMRKWQNQPWIMQLELRVGDSRSIRHACMAARPTGARAGMSTGCAWK
jgi:hypothetical protein